MKVVAEKENYEVISNCFLCRSTNLTKIFSVESVCLTGYFPLASEDDPIETPVSLLRCKDCDNVQAEELVEPDLMFRDYWYRSSTTQTMKKHLNDIIEQFFVPAGNILDIGSNDGTLLEMAEAKGMEIWGCEPSIALNDASKDVQKKTVNDFFGSEESDFFFNSRSLKFDLITAISMFYDVPEPLQFIQKMSNLLNSGGKAVIEVNYAKSFFDRQNVDMLGQEHLIYYFIDTFLGLVNQTDLFVNDAYLTDMNGGNITFVMSKSDFQSDRLVDLSEQERIWMNDFDFENFEHDVMEGFHAFRGKVVELSKSKSVKVLGASTRGAMVIQMLKLDSSIIDSAVDLQKNKVGRRIPGTDILIEYDPDHEAPDYYMVMPYQFREEIIKRYTPYMQGGGGLLFYRPSHEIVTYDTKAQCVVFQSIEH